MEVDILDIEQQKQWLGQWQAATTALQQQKIVDLTNLSQAEAQQASQNLLALAGAVRPGHWRWTTSGLVEQQYWFHQRQPV